VEYKRQIVVLRSRGIFVLLVGLTLSEPLWLIGTHGF
jgi:hypothetical protein